MDTQLLKQLLDVSFYEANKAKIHRDLFDGDILDLYEIVAEAHDKYGADLTTKELFALWQDANPVATKPNVELIKDTIGKIDGEELLNPELASDLLTGLWQRETGRKIAKLGSDLAQGREDAFPKLEKLLDKSKEGFVPAFEPETTKDIHELLKSTSDESRFKFNIPCFSKRVYGIGRQEFGIIFARPETGKTAFAVSICFGPGGFADQGRKVLYLGNEEATARTMLRAYQAWTGMTLDEVRASPDLARERFELIEDKVTMMNCQGWDITEVEDYIKKVKPDVVVIDQGDKISISGNYDAPHLKLRELYTEFREVAKRQDVALFVMSQASAEGEGKSILTASMLENSKTGKFAEADLIIGIGKYADAADGTYDPMRFLNVCKNKLSGWHGTEPCKLEAKISRYED